MARFIIDKQGRLLLGSRSTVYSVYADCHCVLHSITESWFLAHCAWTLTVYMMEIVY